MELLRRSAQGRLSELFGAGADGSILAQDQLFRTLGLTAVAKEHLAASAARTKRALRACAVGIERYRQKIAAGTAPLPREFVDLGGVLPAPWAAADSLLIGVYLQMSLDMPSGRRPAERDRQTDHSQ